MRMGLPHCHDNGLDEGTWKRWHLGKFCICILMGGFFNLLEKMATHKAPCIPWDQLCPVWHLFLQNAFSWSPPLHLQINIMKWTPSWGKVQSQPPSLSITRDILGARSPDTLRRGLKSGVAALKTPPPLLGIQRVPQINPPWRWRALHAVFMHI